MKATVNNQKQNKETTPTNMHWNNSFTTHSSEDSIYSSIKKQFSVNVIELYYDSIVFASPELSRPVEKKNELTQEMFKFVSPCESIYTVEKNMKLIVLYD